MAAGIGRRCLNDVDASSIVRSETNRIFNTAGENRFRSIRAEF